MVGVVVAPFVCNDEGKILYFKSVKWKGWVPLGGHVEYGGTLIDALKRETKEETGLDIKTIKLINVGEMIEPKDFYKPHHFIYFHYLCKIRSGTLKLDRRELTDYKWLDPVKGLRRKDVLAKDTLRKLIKSYLS